MSISFCYFISVQFFIKKFVRFKKRNFSIELILLTLYNVKDKNILQQTKNELERTNTITKEGNTNGR